MVNIRTISPELAAKSQTELNEVESRSPNDIAALREWIQKQPHLKARTDDQFLVTFLRGNKYSLEKTKHKIDYYYTIRNLSPELFLNRTVDDKVLRLSKLGPFVPLPKPLKPDGPRLHITRYGHIDPKDFNMVDLFKYQLRIFDIELHEDDNAAIAGVANIIDMSNMSLGFLLQFDPVLVKKFSTFSDKALPFRIKGLHMINPPKEAVAVINIAQSFMSKKLRDRMTMHMTFESLYQHIPKEYLPEEYGGNNGRLQDSIDLWAKKMYDHKDFFEEDSQYRADEKLRQGTQMTHDSLFGLEGSFRKLEVD